MSILSDKIPAIGLFALSYLVGVVVLSLINRREFKRSPEKGKRYGALPLHFKFACWFLVLPMFAGIVLEPAFFLPALIAFFLLESACVRWYRRERLY